MTEVIRPFKNYVVAGSNTFTVPLPQQWIQNRGFYFEKIYLLPDYYSKQAAAYNLDPQMELSEEMLFQLALTLRYTSSKTFYPDPFDVRTVSLKTKQFINQLNQSMETKKPTIFQKIPFFIDYSLTDYDVEVDPLDEIKEQAMILFGENFDATKHLNALPSSIQSVPHVNNVIFPGSLDEDTLEMIRLRLWIAPHTKVTFSNDLILKQMGFHPSQLGSRTDQKQYIVGNNTERWQTLEASQRPQMSVSAPSGLRITVGPIADNLSTKLFTFKIKREEYLKNTTLQNKLNTFLQKLGTVVNIKLGLDYDITNHKFKLKLDTDNSLYIVLHLTPELSKRLGYHLTPFIDGKLPSEVVLDQPDLKDIESKAKSLVLDCGMVLVCLDNASSTTLVGSNDLIMTCLFPDAQGLLCSYNSCVEPNMVRLTTHIAGPDNTINVKFNLLRLYEDQELKKFEWTVGAYIYGVLRGRLYE